MSSSDSAALGALLAALLIPLLICIPLTVLMIVSGWKVFTKAGQPGWGVLIPIFNVYLWVKMAGKPGWWVVLMILPVVSFVIGILLAVEIAKAFGKSTGFAVLMIFLPIIALPILAFGDATYRPPLPA